MAVHLRPVIARCALAAVVVCAAPSAAQSPVPPARIVKIVGGSHMLLLRADGTVAGWGRFDHGQLGPLAAITPTRRRRAAGLVAIQLPGKAVDIAAGDFSSYALLDDGTVYAWGRADHGALGIGSVTAPLLAGSSTSSEYRGIETPTRIPGLDEVTAIAAAGYSGYAVRRDGTVRAWGAGPIGDGRAPSEYGGRASSAGPALTPVPVPNLRGITALSVSADVALALTADGRVYSWGRNFYGALGRPPRIELSLDTPAEIPGLTDVAQVAAGPGVSTALRTDGTVWVWGSNWQQQFGFAAPTDQPGPDRGWVLEPQRVPGVAGAAQIAVGTGRQTIVRLRDGTLRVWGNTDFGQLGTGSGPGYQPLPVAIRIAGVAAVFAAGNNTFAVRTDGALWAWGAGDAGEFPLTSNVRLPAPAPPGLR